MFLQAVDRPSWTNETGKSQSAIFNQTISKHRTSEIHRCIVTINLRVIYSGTVHGVNNPFNSEGFRKTWDILVFKNPGLNGFDRVGVAVFTQRVFGQGGLVM